MKFRLTYEGELFATQGDAHGAQRVPKAAQKHAIRRNFHRQLKHYWETDIVLKNATSSPGTEVDPEIAPFVIDGGGVISQPLSEVIASQHDMFGYRWVPLVRDGSRLNCFINVLMMRRDGGASVFTAGDIDNRIKTLLDCLRVPVSSAELVGNEQPQDGENPFFCLLRDDKLITGFSVETDQLYDYPDDAQETFVKLVISVEIRPYSVGFDNLHFL
jgi:hypothetical protein